MINWDRVDELRHEVGPEDFNEVIELFLEEVDDTISTLGMCDGNRTLEEQLHFLKGSALNIGFSDFASLCHAGETASAKDGRIRWTSPRSKRPMAPHGQSF